MLFLNTKFSYFGSYDKVNYFNLITINEFDFKLLDFFCLIIIKKKFRTNDTRKANIPLFLYDFGKNRLIFYRF